VYDNNVAAALPLTMMTAAGKAAAVAAIRRQGRALPPVTGA